MVEAWSNKFGRRQSVDVSGDCRLPRWLCLRLRYWTADWRATTAYFSNTFVCVRNHKE